MSLTSAAGLGRTIAAAVVATMAANAWSGATKADDSSALAAAQANAYKFVAGTETKPPVSGPKAVAGKSIYVISCGQAVPGCSLQTNAALEAGKTLGWDVTLFDGSFGANDGFNKGIRQAIAAHANGIILVSIDCNMVTQPLREAKSAGLKVIGQNSFPCADDPSLMTAMDYSSSTPSLASYGHAEGVARGLHHREN
jgi:ribose transport system substrate-binding protein